MKAPLPRLHAITDERIARRQDCDAVTAALVRGGRDALALHARGRALSGLAHYTFARRLAAHPPALLFVNDRLDIALTAGAAGVQLGHGSLAPREARRLHPDWWIGCSVHSLAEAQSARDNGADYLLAGAVFATATHPGRAPLGIAGLRAICGLGLPVIAIGGVGAAEAPAVREAGAYGVAAIRALWDAADPETAARMMLEAYADR